jgi:hypothetical protein
VPNVFNVALSKRGITPAWITSWVLTGSVPPRMTSTGPAKVDGSCPCGTPKFHRSTNPGISSAAICAPASLMRANSGSGKCGLARRRSARSAAALPPTLDHVDHVVGIAAQGVGPGLPRAPAHAGEVDGAGLAVGRVKRRNQRAPNRCVIEEPVDEQERQRAFLLWVHDETSPPRLRPGGFLTIGMRTM